MPSASPPTERLLVPDSLLVGSAVRSGWAVLVRGDEIAEVGPAEQLAQRPGAMIERFPRILLMPGTVNAHSHSFQSLLRGAADDMDFSAWRAELYRRAPLFDEEGVHTAALMSFSQMLLAGVTTVCDFFYLHHGGIEFDLAVIAAAAEVGIRLVFVRSLLDWEGAPQAFRETSDEAVTNTRRLAAAAQGRPRLSIIPGPHSPHAASVEMIRAGASLAREWNVPWHMHVAEAPYEVDLLMERSGQTPVAWLASQGLLDPRLRVVHGVWVDPSEIQSLARVSAGLIHCPGANLFLGDGIAPLRAYLAAGVSCALGCDSGSANSRLAVFHEMRLAALIAKGMSRSGAAVGAAEALAMATVGGANATGLSIGEVKSGAAADFVACDLDDLSLQPETNTLGNLVYSMELSAVRHVFVAGEAVVRDRQLVRRSASSIVAQYRGWAQAHPRARLDEAAATS